jgi:hypothetical protein
MQLLLIKNSYRQQPHRLNRVRYSIDYCPETTQRRIERPSGFWLAMLLTAAAAPPRAQFRLQGPGLIPAL